MNKKANRETYEPSHRKGEGGGSSSVGFISKLVKTPRRDGKNYNKVLTLLTYAITRGDGLFSSSLKRWGTVSSTSGHVLLTRAGEKKKKMLRCEAGTGKGAACTPCSGHPEEHQSEGKCIRYTRKYASILTGPLGAIKTSEGFSEKTSARP